MKLGWVLLAAFAAGAMGCPKRHDNPYPTPKPTPTRSDAAPTPLGSIALADPTPSGRYSPMTVTYRWSGGLSMYQWISMTITADDTAQVVFKVKPLKTDEKTVNDTLDAAQTKELRDLFDQVKFDDAQMVPRRVKILDLGETLITRDMDGKKKEVREDPGTSVSTDIHPLRQWFDAHVRTYLDKAGVAPAHPTPKPT
jgi:hypothetical protein